MKLILFIFIPMLLFGQNRYFSDALFKAGQDTISSTTSQDTVDWRAWTSGVDVGAWNILTDYVSAAEKAAGTTLKYSLPDETNWMWVEYVQFRIRGNGTKATATSKTHSIGSLNGYVTLFIDPDTSSGSTVYAGSKLGGN